MKLLITTQDYENYAWREDGTLGTGSEAYWKAKGGEDFFVPLSNDSVSIDQVIDQVRSKIEVNNEGFTRTIIHYVLVEDDYQTDFEKSQLEYDGHVAYPAQIIEI